MGWASTCRIKAIEYGVKHLHTASKARQRWGARGIESQEKKFYNLMGGQFSRIPTWSAGGRRCCSR
eukprot:4057160-Prymnesium_polylepis.1